MKKEIKDRYFFRKYFRVRPEFNDEIQTSTSYIKDEIQISIEKNIIGKKIKEKSFWLHGDEMKNFSL